MPYCYYPVVVICKTVHSIIIWIPSHTLIISHLPSCSIMQNCKSTDLFISVAFSLIVVQMDANLVSLLLLILYLKFDLYSEGRKVLFEVSMTVSTRVRVRGRRSGRPPGVGTWLSLLPTYSLVTREQMFLQRNPSRPFDSIFTIGFRLVIWI